MATVKVELNTASFHINNTKKPSFTNIYIYSTYVGNATLSNLAIPITPALTDTSHKKTKVAKENSTLLTS